MKTSMSSKGGQPKEKEEPKKRWSGLRTSLRGVGFQWGQGRAAGSGAFGATNLNSKKVRGERGEREVPAVEEEKRPALERSRTEGGDGRERGAGVFSSASLKSAKTSGELDVEESDEEWLASPPPSEPPDDFPGDTSARSAESSVAMNGPCKSTPADRGVIKRLGILTLPGEEGVLELLAVSIASSPLPSPWVMLTDSKGRVFYANPLTNASQWEHPCEITLRNLAGVARTCLSLPQALRENCVNTLRGVWDSEIRRTFSMWYPVQQPNSAEYYAHRQTREVMWEHPAQIFLPPHYLRVKVLEMLSEASEVATLRSMCTGMLQTIDEHLALLPDANGEGCTWACPGGGGGKERSSG